ncbi:MAG: hypothetical protein IJL17_13085 [Kiritimatiellae bacterium]|nr:hypothetical protein [Kiritimatiellia bacterium]
MWQDASGRWFPDFIVSPEEAATAWHVVGSSGKSIYYPVDVDRMKDMAAHEQSAYRKLLDRTGRVTHEDEGR